MSTDHGGPTVRRRPLDRHIATEGHRPIERLSPDDAVTLATDVGPLPMHVGAVLVLDERLELDRLVGRVEERLPAVPRLRQRLLRTPLFGGRAVWVDDDRFDLGRHLSEAPQGAADLDELTRVALATIGRRFEPDRPLWRLQLVRLADGRAALVVAFHHVLADGIGGLAVLAALVDDADVPPSDPSFPRPRPTGSQLRRDAARTRLATVLHPGAPLRRSFDALAQLRPTGPAARRSSLNAPTGSQRSLLSAQVPLEPLHAAARRHGATVNDALLTAVGGAVGALLAERGEAIDELVISVPMSARAQTGGAALGNQVGAVPVRVPLEGRTADRLECVASRTERARSRTRGASAAVLGPVFRALGTAGVFGWFVEHQRLVHTFVTNLRGPQHPLSLLGATITQVRPVAMIAGNVTVSFAALSYAGTLGVTIIVDPVACPDAASLRAHLQDQLDELCSLADPPVDEPSARRGARG